MSQHTVVMVYDCCVLGVLESLLNIAGFSLAASCTPSAEEARYDVCCG